MAEKIIDKDRFWYNPETGDKRPSHYTDGSEIKVDESFKLECKKACNRQAMKAIEASPKLKSKPKFKREGKRGDEGIEFDQPVAQPTHVPKELPKEKKDK